MAEEEKKEPGFKNISNKELQHNLEGYREESTDRANLMDEKLTAVLDLLKGMNAKDRPIAAPRNYPQATDAEAHVPDMITTVKENDAGPELITENIPNIKTEGFKDIADTLAFNQEIITVRMHDTAEKQADRVVKMQINGETEYFIRGQMKTCRRMFVEGLTRCKPIHYENQPLMDHEGVKSVRYVAHRGLRFAFEVVNDPNPRGKAWLEECLAA